MRRPRFARRAIHAILSRPWEKLVTEDFGFHVAHQTLAMVGCKELLPTRAISEEGAARKAW